ncbi:uncharacterized protein LOC141641817 [Silene latifolia]|uniref:uncharacterized protein LOC141641817 n=1 Tax=Silene latifolia TaxID=37657 RepID=UPI003D76F050
MNGSLCFAHDQRAKGDKFASRSRKCVFMGYPMGKKCRYLYDLDTEGFFVSRDVVFYEDQFPFKNDVAPHSSSTTSSNEYVVDWECDDVPDSQPTTTRVQAEEPGTVVHTGVDIAPNTAAGEGEVSGSDGTVVNNNGCGETVLGRGHRTKIPNKNLRDYVLDSTLQNSPSDALQVTVPSSVSGMSYPLVNYIVCNKFSVEHRAYLAAIASNKEPRSFKEVVKDEGWRKAMETEMNVLIENGTWTLEPLPARKKALGSK